MKNNNDLNKQIADRLRALCLQNNISVSKMLKNCGLNKGFIYDLEKRNASPSCAEIIEIADYFNVSLDTLTGRDYRSPAGYGEEKGEHC